MKLIKTTWPPRLFFYFIAFFFAVSWRLIIGFTIAWGSLQLQDYFVC